MDKKKILIIDDEPDFVRVVQVRMEAAGYEVVVAFDGMQGVSSAHKEKPDLIILDIMMPAMHGHRVCEALKKSAKTWTIPIIYLTAKGNKEDEELAYKLGAEHFLTKPYDPQVLLGTIEKALEPGSQLEKYEKAEKESS
jgi:two-component system alkaline phosphatase synthesis response regulator PhoP